jgi:hypothetical protein
MSKELRNNFTNYQTLTSREAYDFYREKRKKVAPGINEYNLYKKAIEGLFTVVKDMMVESEGGVYLEGLGYLCMIAYPKEWKRGNIKSKSLFQKLKKQQYYFPYFIPDVELKGWTMSDAFEEKLERKANAQDIKYKLHFDLVDTLRLANDYANKSVNYRKGKGEFDYRGQLIKKLNR